MTVHLAGSLPSDDLNGLTHAEQQLVEGHLARRQYLTVGVVMVTGIKTLEKEGFKPNPIISFERVEIVPEQLSAEALALLQRIFAARTGKATLDFPEEATMAQGPLELLSGANAPRVAIIEEAGKKFTLRILVGDSVVVERHALPRKVYASAPAEGEHDLEAIADVELLDLVHALIAEWRSTFTVSEDIVDAEVVDDAEGWVAPGDDDEAADEAAEDEE